MFFLLVICQGPHRPKTIPTYPLQNQRLKLRKSFATVQQIPQETTSKTYKITNVWNVQTTPKATIQNPTKKLPKGTNLNREEWCTLNRKRMGISKTGDNLTKWGLKSDSRCECGESIQNLNHKMENCPFSNPIRVGSQKCGSSCKNTALHLM